MSTKPTTFIGDNSKALSVQLDEFVDFVRDCVEPRKRPELAIKKWHKTVLVGSKKCGKKQKEKQPLKKKSESLSRKQFSDLGLYTVPTRAIKYQDMLPLHELWLQYIFNHLKVFITQHNGHNRIPDVYDSNYDAFSKALVKSDFHGAMITVIGSNNPTMVNKMGIIIMDTKNTLKIVSKDDRVRTIPKGESVFKILIKDIEFRIFGKYLKIRSAERSVKKIKNVMEPDL